MSEDAWDDDEVFVWSRGRLSLKRYLNGYPWRFQWRRWYWSGALSAVSVHLCGPYELIVGVEGWRWAAWLDRHWRQR